MEEKNIRDISAKRGDLRILAIGNSFSDDTLEYVWSMAKSAGYDSVFLGNLYIGGCTLELHAANAAEDKKAYEYRTNGDGVWHNRPGVSISEALSSGEWDFISLQQASGKSGICETYEKLGYLIDYVRGIVGEKPTLVWNMTWAYQQINTHGEFMKYGCDQMKMYGMILSAVSSEVVGKHPGISLVSPSGTAIQNARTSFVGDTLTRDGYHLSYGLGRFVAGLTFFCTVSGASPDEVSFTPDTVSAEERKAAVISVKNALSHPYRVTPADAGK